MCLACGTDRTTDLWMLACRAAGEKPADWSARGLEAVRPVLAAHGLELRAGPGDLRLATRGGRQLRIRDLGSVWDAAEQLLGRPLDPLSPATLSAARDADA
jgi:hypothetical protein